MPSPNDCWGIEVGANALKAIHLQREGKKDLKLAGFDILPYKKVLTTPDIDKEEVIRLALNQFKAKHDLTKSTVVVSVPGHSSFARFAKLPPVEPKKVPDIVKFEAVQQIPFPIDQVEWDYQIFQDPDTPDVEVGIFAITRERAMNWLANFRAVGIPVHGVSLAPVASYNALAHDLELGPESPGTIIMDIGTSATDLIIVEGSRLWLRTIPIGGHHFTEALVRSFKLSYSKAEKIKREAATSKYARQIFQAMRPIFVDLVGEVQKSLGFYQSANRDAELKQLVGLGATFRLPGLQKFLKQQLQIEVQRLQKFNRIQPASKLAAQFNDNACSLTPSYGLALQGMEVERVSCNLLPVTLARRQIWQRKQPWMVAATLAIAASAGIAYTAQVMDRNAFEEQAPIRSQISQVISQAETYQRDIRAIEGGADPRLKIENIRSTLEYRTIWPKVLEDIEEALQTADPQPALLSGDPEAIKAIPRDQRRLLHVRNIEYEYVLGEETIDLRIAPRERDQRGGRRGGRQMDMYDDYDEYETGGRTTRSTAPAGPDPDARPVFEIKLTGTTPYADAYQFLGDTIVRWLQRNSDQRDRPYRILSVEIDDVLPVELAEREDRAGGRRQQQRGLPQRTQPTSPFQQLPGQRRPGAIDEYDDYDEYYDEFSPTRPSVGRTTTPTRRDTRRDTRRPDDYTALLPENPLAEEDATQDWRFVIRWRIEILDPEERRERDAEDDLDADPDTPDLADAEGHRE